MKFIFAWMVFFFFDRFSWEADLITIEILIGKRICLSLLRKKEIEETLTMALVIVGKVAETASKSTFCWKWINQLDPLTYQKWIGQLDPLNFDVSCARCTFEFQSCPKANKFLDISQSPPSQATTEEFILLNT